MPPIICLSFSQRGTHAVRSLFIPLWLENATVGDTLKDPNIVRETVWYFCSEFGEQTGCLVLQISYLSALLLPSLVFLGQLSNVLAILLQFAP